MVAKALLESMGCSVTTANDGEQALALLHQHSFDLILLDHYMPGLTGAEIASQLTEAGNSGDKTCSLVALSGADSDEDQAMLLASGFDLVLKKPVSGPMLEALLGVGGESASGVISRDKAQSLTADLGDESAKMLYGLFRQELIDLGGRLEQALSASDAGEINAVSHILKNSAAMYGAHQVADAARHLNEADNIAMSEQLELTRDLVAYCQAAVSDVDVLFPSES